MMPLRTIFTEIEVVVTPGCEKARLVGRIYTDYYALGAPSLRSHVQFRSRGVWNLGSCGE